MTRPCRSNRPNLDFRSPCATNQPSAQSAARGRKWQQKGRIKDNAKNHEACVAFRREHHGFLRLHLRYV